MVPAAVARWKRLTVDTGDLMLTGVVRIVNDPVNPRDWNHIPWLVFIPYGWHTNPPTRHTLIFDQALSPSLGRAEYAASLDSVGI